MAFRFLHCLLPPLAFIASLLIHFVDSFVVLQPLLSTSTQHAKKAHDIHFENKLNALYFRVNPWLSTLKGSQAEGRGKIFAGVLGESFIVRWSPITRNKLKNGSCTCSQNCQCVYCRHLVSKTSAIRNMHPLTPPPTGKRKLEIELVFDYPFSLDFHSLSHTQIITKTTLHQGKAAPERTKAVPRSETREHGFLQATGT